MSQEIPGEEKYNLAQKQARDGNIEEALIAFQELVDSHPEIAIYQLRLATAYQGIGDLEHAVVAFKAGTELWPEKETVSRYLFECLWSLDRRQEAIEEAKRLLSIKDSEYYTGVLEEIKAVEVWTSEMEATQDLPAEMRIEKLQERIARGPVYSKFYQDLADLQVRAGAMEEAQQTFDRAIELFPDNAWNHLYFGNWFYHLGDYAAALSRFEKARELMPDDSTPYWCSAEMLEKLGRLEEADKNFRKALSLDPTEETVKAKYDEWCQRLLEYKEKQKSLPH